MITALLFVLMLLVLIIPHEFAHMVVAKLCGVKVEEFSVGMGPLIFKRQKGETQYSIRLLPLGGFCRMEGEDEEHESPRAFNNKKPSQKIAILLAGVMMNVLIAYVIVSVMVCSSGVATNTLASVEKDSVAYEAGLRAGDKIIAVDGREVKYWDETVVGIANYREGDRLELTIQRGDSVSNKYPEPKFNEELGRYTIGITSKSSKSLAVCLPYSAHYLKALNTEILMSFKKLFTGKLNRDEVAGPVGMVKAVDQVKDYGASSYWLFLAVVSLNLALLNILPFPSLDGGRILFVLIRMVTGKAISDEFEALVHAAGILMLFGLFIVLTINDVINLF